MPDGDVIDRMYREFDDHGGSGNYRAAMTDAYAVARAHVLAEQGERFTLEEITQAAIKAWGTMHDQTSSGKVFVRGDFIEELRAYLAPQAINPPTESEEQHG